MFCGKKYFTKKLFGRTKEALESEIETYDLYLTGEIYGFNLTDEDGVMDSCYGFYGENIWENGITEYLPAVCVIELYSQLKEIYGANDFMEKKIKELVVNE